MNRKVLLILLIIATQCYEVSNAQIQGQAFMRHDLIKVSGAAVSSDIDNLPAGKVQTDITYFDGLGRTIQKNNSKATPDGKDVVQPYVYNNSGQQTVNYLPYADNSTDGSFQSNAIADQLSFYNNTSQHLVATDAAPYSQQVFENSPLQRIIKSGTIGSGFQPGQHYKSMVYRFNQSGDGNILIWNFDGTFTSGNYYAANSLAVAIGTDEDGVTTTTFTDIAGHLILKRQMVNGNTLNTYYLYNAAGMPIFILPNAAISRLAAKNYDLTVAVIANQIFAFTYDNLGRLITKRVPSKGIACIVYDPLNRPILMQDANMAANKQWNYIKYDVKGRAISQGLYTDATNIGQGAMQAYINSLSFSTYYESRSSSGTTGYYTNNAFPTTGTALAYSYYDDYDLNQDGSPDFSYNAQGLPNEETATKAALKGVPTILRLNTITNNTPTNNWLIKVIFYDKRGNTIQVQSNNQLHYSEAITDYSTSVPDFIGIPQVTKVSKMKGTTNDYVRTNYTYDAMNRVNNITQSYNGAAAVQIAAYTYNEIGQLVQKALGGTTGSPLQNVNLRFNIRGQLVNINNSKLTNDGGITSSDSNDLFGMQMLYDQVDANLGNTAFFNGKLSAVKWMSKDASNNASNERSYKFSYDGINRYTGETYAERLPTAGPTAPFNVHTDAYDEHNITYDGNGNITGLARNALNTTTNTNTVIDNLTYTYSATNLNLLISITDSGNQQGFNNITGSTGTYTYDANGNLTADPYKGIAVAYNFLNKTDSIRVINGAGGAAITGMHMDYTYDASGQLLTKRVYSSSMTTIVTDYVDGFTYSGPATSKALVYFAMPEGRVVLSPARHPEYIITDQQGNARISFVDNGSGVAVVTQENSYYGFGLIVPNSPVATPSVDNKKLYNGGSEWQNDYANLPDYYQTFYRNYDAAIARFVGIDPDAENTESMTPYQYAADNPMVYNDPAGNDSNPVPWTNSPWENESPVNPQITSNPNWYDMVMQIVNSPNGGYANADGTVGTFATQQAALNAGIAYANSTNSWGYTTSGSAQQTASNFNAITGQTYSYEDNAGYVTIATWYHRADGTPYKVDNNSATIIEYQASDLYPYIGNANQGNDNANKEGENATETPKIAELAGSIISEADNGATIAKGIRYMQTGKEAVGALKWVGNVTGALSVGNNVVKAWNERHTNGWQSALHLSEAVAQTGIMIFGGEEIELAWNLGSLAIDAGVDYYNHSHDKE